MKKLLVLLALAIFGFLLPTSAQAAPAPIAPVSYQKICNSSATPQNYPVQYGSAYGFSINPGNCKTLPTGTSLRIDARSFKVAYNYGDYRACQNIPYDHGYMKIFTPSRTPDVIYFKIYKNSNCRN